MILPKKVFFTKGVGYHAKELQSFEYALRDAGISQFNLSTISSILPPYCQEVPRNEGLNLLKDGQIVFLVMARACAEEKNRLISASIGVAKPKDISHYGYLSEHHAYGEDEKFAGEFSEDLAASMLASTLGIPFDVDANYDEKRQLFMLSDLIVETKNINASATVRKQGEYCTTVAAAVFVCDLD